RTRHRSCQWRRSLPPSSRSGEPKTTHGEAGRQTYNRPPEACPLGPSVLRRVGGEGLVCGGRLADGLQSFNRAAEVAIDAAAGNALQAVVAVFFLDDFVGHVSLLC